MVERRLICKASRGYLISTEKIITRDSNINGHGLLVFAVARRGYPVSTEKIIIRDSNINGHGFDHYLLIKEKIYNDNTTLLCLFILEPEMCSEMVKWSFVAVE